MESPLKGLLQVKINNKSRVCNQVPDASPGHNIEVIANQTINELNERENTDTSYHKGCLYVFRNGARIYSKLYVWILRRLCTVVIISLTFVFITIWSH